MGFLLAIHHLEKKKKKKKKKKMPVTFMLSPFDTQKL